MQVLDIHFNKKEKIMKKIILAILIALSPMIAKDSTGKQNPFFNVKNSDGGSFLLDSLPHFMGMYMKHGGMHKIKPSEEQEVVLEKQFEKMVKVIIPSREKIRKIENEIVFKVVFEGAGEKELIPQLSEVADLKKKLTNIQIECLNIFKKTLTKEQYQVMIDMAIKHSKER